MYLELAKKYIVKAKASSGSTRQYFANLCQVCLAKEGASPEDIGVTKQELANLQSREDKITGNTKRLTQIQKDYVAVCTKYLEQCRQAYGASRQYYANLCSTALAKYGLDFSQIGTTDEELQYLQTKGFLESAANYLEEARKTKGARRKCYADLCWEYLAKAKSSPGDIGATENELTQLSI